MITFGTIRRMVDKFCTVYIKLPDSNPITVPIAYPDINSVPFVFNGYMIREISGGESELGSYVWFDVDYPYVP